VQPDEAIKLAIRLLDDPNAPEADIRSAAHHAYYGVYHLVCRFFRLDPFKDISESKHKAVRDRLAALNSVTSPPEIKEAKRVFERLFKIRVRADYDWQTVFEAGDAEDAVEYAKGVFGRISQPATGYLKSENEALAARPTSGKT
jgi:uncharacterized protein (UPF0332 family)